MLAHFFKGLRVSQAVAIGGDIGAGAGEGRLQAVRLLLVIFQLEIELRLALAIDRGLQGHVRVEPGVGERAVLDLGLHARDLGLQGGHLGDQRAHISRGERRIETGQNLTGMDHVARVHVDRPHDGGLQRLDDDRGRARDDKAVGGHHPIHLDHAGEDQHDRDHLAEASG